MPSERVGIVVQVRMSSIRLPGKALISIEGKPLLQRLCDRVSRSRRAGALVVATSDQPADDSIEAACRAWGVPVFRGPERDPVVRVLGAARRYALALIVRVTGDNPLTDPKGIDELIEGFQDGKPDWASTGHLDGYPYGTGADLFRVSALKRCSRIMNNGHDRENFPAFLREHPEQFSFLKLGIPRYLVRSNYFFSADYPEDIALLGRIYAHFDGRDDMPLPAILQYLDTEPGVARLNSHLHQPFAD
ncbi:MAG TPA: NTP transferase domain-containing protein [Terriglobia bacterium]|nr:NTP transferase domain-containing protein [Terriglobia bacterium]